MDPDDDDEVENVESVRGEIELRHVDFAYPSRPDQELALFAASIFDNIAYCKDVATEAEVVEATQVANVHTFVSGLPEGYKTWNPSILLLDEATSALDAESECMLQEALERLMRD
ncbi:ABC transporter B family member 19 [Olea europaea subsp. europaea]|uniref:ABC transporter B family member 19 n=1 Tax=Olea europaea subsp. europaea TaxID=158383 RepID=A0A8S0UYR3_OLEEU|nr:ABC transporter B family member 19 [Olea europaea subsp. europaea]